MTPDEVALFTKSIQQAVAAHTAADLDRALDELGWAEALEVSPDTAVGALFGAQGAAVATSSALHRVLAAGLGLGSAGAPVLLPRLGAHDRPGLLVDEHLRVSGLAFARCLGEGHVLVPVHRSGEEHVVPVETADLVLRPVQGLDPGCGLVEVTGTVPLAAERAPSRAVETAPSPWSGAVALGHRALAAELVGTGRTMLELARIHALDREQFGRPISAFQAVRHRLADTLVALESADDLIAASWEDDSPVPAAMAKAVAGRAARTAARHCQQVLAGIGFTTEHRFHRYLRRALLLDELLGSARTLTRELGDDLLASRRLPALLPL